jgi:uncharacterized protein YaaN involved in tellurite resistance
MTNLTPNRNEAVIDMSKEAVIAEVQGMINTLPDAQEEHIAMEMYETAKKFDFVKDNLNEFETWGEEAVKSVAAGSDMLNVQIKEFQNRGAETSPIAKNLLLLEENIGIIDPNKVDFNKTSLMGKFIKALNPIKKYFESFQTVGQIIAKIRTELLNGKKQLQSDNIVMEKDTKRLVGTIEILTKQIRILNRGKELIMEEANNASPERKAQLEEHIIYLLAQKEMDMHTLNNVAMQAVMAMNILIRNNKEFFEELEETLKVNYYGSVNLT